PEFQRPPHGQCWWLASLVWVSSPNAAKARPAFDLFEARRSPLSSQPHSLVKATELPIAPGTCAPSPQSADLVANPELRLDYRGRVHAPRLAAFEKFR